MPLITAFDTETHLIGPGELAPPLVCLQWQQSFNGAHVGDAQMCHRDSALAHIEEWLDSDTILVGHNVAYDMAVICAQLPHLIPKVFAKYQRNQVTDTMLREQLIMISRGTFRSAPNGDGDLKPISYALAACVYRHFGIFIPKDGWRLMYRAFDVTPNMADWLARAAEFRAQCAAGNWPDWVDERVGAKDREALLAADPQQAITYALDDARHTLRLYESQDAYAKTTRHGPALFADEFRKARAAFALHLSSCWGIYTDPDAVDKLEFRLQQQFKDLIAELQEAGIVRDDGTVDTEAARAAMVAECEAEGFPVIMTSGGKSGNKQVALSAEACERFDETSVMHDFQEFQTCRKMLSNDIKMLKKGCDVPMQPRYDFADTGRTRCASPNIQAINRGEGIREAFRPREGKVFAAADYSALELHTRAAWCLEVIGWSKLADTLNSGVDAHLQMAAKMMGIPYEEAKARLKAKDKEVKKARQGAKAINFGRPGGLGDKKFVKYAWKTYGVRMTLEEAAKANESWKADQPEILEFFRLAAAATNNPTGLGDETHVFTGRVRGNVRYSSLCNGRFQGLGADAALEALWRVTYAQYCVPTSPLYGTRVVGFIHDEIIIEVEEERASEALMELERVMGEGANVYLHKVPVKVEGVLMRLWSKSAERIVDKETGRVLPWSPDEEKTT